MYYNVLAGYPASLGHIPLSSLPILYSPIYHPSLRLGPTKGKGMVLYSDVSSPLDRSKRFTLSSPGRPVHSDTVLGSMVLSHNGSQKKLFRLHEPNHSYYKNSYVTIAFNVARPFCLMDVSQWLQNLNESFTNVQNVACICRNNSYNIYIAPPRVGLVKKNS